MSTAAAVLCLILIGIMIALVAKMQCRPLNVIAWISSMSMLLLLLVLKGNG